MMLRGLVVCGGLASLMALACGSTKADGEPAGSAGAAGAEGAAEAGKGGESPGAGGSECAEGSGTVIVEITGLPDGVAPEVEIDGPDGATLSGPGTFEDVCAGTYTFAGKPKVDDDPVVRALYRPVSAEISPSSGRLSDGSELSIAVAYEALRTSNKLWLASPGKLSGFSSADLGESATLAAPIDVEARVGSALLFDLDGNIWTNGASATDPMILRYDADDLAESGAVEPVFEIDVPGIDCQPAISAMAFDHDGFLWLGTCDQRVLLFAEDESGEYEVDTQIVGFSAIRSLAFDAEGQLWVADDGALERYDPTPADSLDAAAQWSLGLTMTLRDAGGTQLLSAGHLAFDADGNLWATDPDSDTVLMVKASDLAGSGEKELAAHVSIVPAEATLLGGLAFDGSGELWVALGGGRFGKLGADQLGTSSDEDEPTTPAIVIESNSVGDASGLGFFPAASKLPLHHAW